MRLFLSFYILFFTNLYADALDINTSYLDTTHKIISDKVTDYSTTLDKGISTLFAKDKPKTENNKLANSTNTVDTFFRNEKYINETEKSFVSVNFNTQFQSKYKQQSAMSVTAHIALKRTNKKLNLFISGVNDDENKKIIDKNSPTEIGLNYFRADHYKIKSKYSIGIRGFNLFLRARYYKVFNPGSWKIEPMQIFEYSTRDHFNENTFVYFDKSLSEKKLFRIALHRGTQTKTTGMDYDISAQYYWNFNSKTILQFAEIFAGNTKYKVDPEAEEYSGINNYTTVINFRKNVWKKWFFYEISPSINFHKENDYKANYAIKFLINIYFGNFGNKL